MPEMALAQEVFDELWDFDDPAGSERRFRDASALTTGTESSELLTQAARAAGLDGRFDDALGILRAIVADETVVRTRIALEHGRVLNSSGRPAEAVPHFEDAERLAAQDDLPFLRLDALHMLAIADPAHAEQHTRSALRVLDGVYDERTMRWGISLHNNLGWYFHEAARYDEALIEFEEAHRAANSVGTEMQRYVARWAIARCLRSLGRASEALDMQRQLHEEDPSDPLVLEELAALGASGSEEA
jgi:tetratricopeptide (TPR) repeat protein